MVRYFDIFTGIRIQEKKKNIKISRASEMVRFFYFRQRAPIRTSYLTQSFVFMLPSHCCCRCRLRTVWWSLNHVSFNQSHFEFERTVYIAVKSQTLNYFPTTNAFIYDPTFSPSLPLTSRNLFSLHFFKQKNCKNLCTESFSKRCQNRKQCETRKRKRERKRGRILVLLTVVSLVFVWEYTWIQLVFYEYWIFR